MSACSIGKLAVQEVQKVQQGSDPAPASCIWRLSRLDENKPAPPLGDRIDEMGADDMSGRRSSNKGAWLLLGHSLPARDLFSLPYVPDRPRPKYQRLSRYDQTGLVWLLHGRRVVELTKDKAVIETATGTVSYRRYNKPALGPLGLNDFAPGSAAIATDKG
jgi:hypothetical protein